LLAAGATPERVVVIPCGVDRDRFNPCGPPWPPSTGRPRVVVVSRLVERKGIGNVITALADVPGAELLIAGGPPEGLLEDDPEARRLAAVAERAGVRDRVELLGAVDRGRVPSLLRSADVVACCPWYEPFGLVAVEAMACGRPVVATEVGGLAETVVDGETGLLVPPRRPDHIAAALRRLVDDPDAVQRMGANGTVRARHYAWDRIAAVLLAEMGTVVAERRRGRARLTVSEEDR
jgi:D-inositol-3-phosphate glycosyltransferase